MGLPGKLGMIFPGNKATEKSKEIMMQISVTGRNFAVTEPIKNYVDGKVLKLDKYTDKIKEAHIVLQVEKFRHIAEITLYLKDFKLTATEETRDMYASIDNAWDNLHKQLLKLRDRIKEHRGRNGARKASFFKGLLRAVEEKIMPKDKNQTVIKRSFSPKPMSVEEACLELDLFKDNFMVFKNSETDIMNVVYKREDGNYGLIVPE